MDRIIEQEKGFRRVFTKKALPYWGGALFLAFVIYLIARPNDKTLRVDMDTLMVSEAQLGEFNDYIRISGRVQPMTTIQLSPQEGGIVQEILIEEGSAVKAGDAILILSNDNLDMQILNSEAELAEKENILRNTQIQMEQQKLDVNQSVLEYGIQVDRLKRAYEQQKSLYEDKLIAREDFLKAEEDYRLAQQKYELIRERSKQDSLYRGTQLDRMEESLDNMVLNMQMIRKRKSNLIVKAPIDGELGLLDVVLGQSITSGTKIGQINSVGTYKVEAQIDEHYIDRVVSGLEATFERQGETYSTSIRKVYPEVRDGKFKADFKFEGEQPDNILHQKKTYPKEFEQISAADYNPDGWQNTDRSEDTKDHNYPKAWKMGFSSDYAGSQAREDFVETIANYIVQSDERWQHIIEVGNSDGHKGGDILMQKLDICRTWLREKWSLDLDALHAEVQERQKNLDWDDVMNLRFLDN